MKNKRLSERKLRIWGQSYLTYKYLWPNIEWAASTALLNLREDKPYVLDIGCGNKPYADLFKDCYYQGVDYTNEDSSPDIVADATDIPIDSGAVSIVFCSQVIEHVPEPQAVVDECYRLLKPGGYLIITGPFYWPLHEEPYDFHRFSKYGFKNLLDKAGFSSYEIRPDGGDWSMIFLSISLKLKRKWTIPIRIIINILGVAFDKFDDQCLSPSNYTILAKR